MLFYNVYIEEYVFSEDTIGLFQQKDYFRRSFFLFTNSLKPLDKNGVRILPIRENGSGSVKVRALFSLSIFDYKVVMIIIIFDRVIYFFMVIDLK